MSETVIAASKLIAAPAERLYAIIADYHNGHPLILPRPYFVALQVEQGGVGAGTVVSFQMKLMGRTQNFRARISEPEPGRVLEEFSETNGAVTRFTVEPRDAGQAAFVTISTAMEASGGLAGKIQGWMTRRLLQPIYVKELEQLAAVAAGQAGSEREL